MLQGLSASYPQGWVHLKAARDEVAQLWLILENLVNSLEANDVLPVFDALIGHSLVDLVAFEHL